MTRTIVAHNRFHLGDHIFNFILFYNIKNYLEDNDIHIEYHLNNAYHWQVCEFVCSKNIHLSDENNIGLNMHIGNNNLSTCIHSEFFEKFSRKLDIYLIAYFNEVLQIIGVPFEMKTLEYTDPDLLVRYERINNIHKNKYAELDFLILNSTAMSGQYSKNEGEWAELINRLNAKFKIAVTEKVGDILCTRDDNLTVKDIAAISTRAKKVIAVSSGPLTGLFNTYTLNNVEVIYAFSFNEIFGHPKFITKTDIKDIYFLAE
jgi:hypothetical protein